MPDNALLKAIKKQMASQSDLRTPAQVKKDRDAQADKGRKAFQENITGRKQTDAQYQSGKKASDARMAAEAKFRKENNVSTDQSSEVLKMRAKYPKELHGLIDSALYIKQKGITPVSSGEPGKTWLNKSDIDYVQNAMKTPQGRARLQQEIKAFRDQRAAISEQYNSPEAIQGRSVGGQIIKSVEQANKGITDILGLNNPTVKQAADLSVYASPILAPGLGIGSLIPGIKDVQKGGVGLAADLMRTGPAMAVTAPIQAAGDVANLVHGIQNPTTAPIQPILGSGANLGMALIPEAGSLAMAGIKRAVIKRAMKSAEGAAVRSVVPEIAQAVETPLSRPIMSQGPGLTVRTDSPDFLTRQAAKRAATDAEIARLEAARAARTAPAPVAPEVPAVPKVKAPEKAPNYYARMKPHEATVTPGKGQEKGFLVTGKSPKGQSLRIFEQDAETAAKMRDNIKAGRDPHEGTKWQHLSSPTPKPVQVPKEAIAPEVPVATGNNAVAPGEKFYYRVHRRPVSDTTVPPGYSMESRHSNGVDSVVSYNRPLSPEEMYKFEVIPTTENFAKTPKWETMPWGQFKKDFPGVNVPDILNDKDIRKVLTESTVKAKTPQSEAIGLAKDIDNYNKAQVYSRLTSQLGTFDPGIASVKHPGNVVYSHIKEAGISQRQTASQVRQDIIDRFGESGKAAIDSIESNAKLTKPEFDNIISKYTRIMEISDEKRTIIRQYESAKSTPAKQKLKTRIDALSEESNNLFDSIASKPTSTPKPAPAQDVPKVEAVKPTTAPTPQTAPKTTEPVRAPQPQKEPIISTNANVSSGGNLPKLENVSGVSLQSVKQWEDGTHLVVAKYKNGQIRGIAKPDGSLVNYSYQVRVKTGAKATDVTWRDVEIPDKGLKTQLDSLLLDDWQKTKEEMGLKNKSSFDSRFHKSTVEAALREGKPVPAEVLADYPDLAAKFGAKETPNAANPTIKPSTEASPSGSNVAMGNQATGNKILDTIGGFSWKTETTKRGSRSVRWEVLVDNESGVELSRGGTKQSAIDGALTKIYGVGKTPSVATKAGLDEAVTLGKSRLETARARYLELTKGKETPNANVQEKPQRPTESVLGQERPAVELPQARKGAGESGPQAQAKAKEEVAAPEFLGKSDANIPKPKPGSPSIKKLAQKIERQFDSGDNIVALADDLVVQRVGKTQWGIYHEGFDANAMSKNGLGGWSKTGKTTYKLVSKSKNLEDILRETVHEGNPEIWAQWVQKIEAQRSNPKLSTKIDAKIAQAELPKNKIDAFISEQEKAIANLQRTKKSSIPKSKSAGAIYVPDIEAEIMARKVLLAVAKTGKAISEVVLEIVPKHMRGSIDRAIAHVVNHGWLSPDARLPKVASVADIDGLFNSKTTKVGFSIADHAAVGDVKLPSGATVNMGGGPGYRLRGVDPMAGLDDNAWASATAAKANAHHTRAAKGAELQLTVGNDASNVFASHGIKAVKAEVLHAIESKSIPRKELLDYLKKSVANYNRTVGAGKQLPVPSTIDEFLRGLDNIVTFEDRASFAKKFWPAPMGTKAKNPFGTRWEEVAKAMRDVHVDSKQTGDIVNALKVDRHGLSGMDSGHDIYPWSVKGENVGLTPNNSTEMLVPELYDKARAMFKAKGVTPTDSQVTNIVRGWLTVGHREYLPGGIANVKTEALQQFFSNESKQSFIDNLVKNNVDRIARVEEKLNSFKAPRRSKQAGSAMDPEELALRVELAARKALKSVYDTGEHLYTQIIKIGKELGLNPKQRAKALEMAKGFDPELGKFHFEPKPKEVKVPKNLPVGEKTLKHADTAQVRESLGMPEYTKTSEAIDDTFRVARDRGLVKDARKIAASVIANPNRPISKYEQAALIARADELDVMSSQKYTQLGDATGGKKQAILDQIAAIEDEYSMLIQASDLTGSAQGAALRLRREASKEITPANLKGHIIKAAGGTLPHDLEARIGALTQKLARANQARAIAERSVGKADAQAALKTVEKAARSPRSRIFTKEAFEEVMARRTGGNRASGTKRRGAAMIDSQDWKDLGIIVGYHIESGIRDFGKLMSKSKEVFPEVDDFEVSKAVEDYYSLKSLSPEKKAAAKESAAATRALKADAAAAKAAGIPDLNKFIDVEIGAGVRDFNQLREAAKKAGFTNLNEQDFSKSVIEVLRARGHEFETAAEAAARRQKYSAVAEARALIEKTRVKAAYEQTKGWERFSYVMGQALAAGPGSIKNLRASFDLSAAGRQGILLSIANPKKGAVAFKNMLESVREAGYEKVIADVHNSKYFDAGQVGGLGIAGTDGHMATDELFTHLPMETKFGQSKLGQGLKSTVGAVPRMSEQTYNAFLSRLRQDCFDAIAAMTEKRTGKLTKKDAEAIASYVNSMTGLYKSKNRGTENVLKGMNHILFSSRFLASRFDVASGMTLAKAVAHGGPLRTQALKDHAVIIGGLASIMGLATLGGGKVQFNPESPDFMQIQFGNQRIDISGGVAPILRAIIRGTTAIEKPIEAYVTKKPYDAPRYGREAGSEIGKFFINRAAPHIRAIANTYQGDAFGRPTDPGIEARNLIMPIGVEQALNAKYSDNRPMDDVFKQSLFEFFGLSTQFTDKSPGEVQRKADEKAKKASEKKAKKKDDLDWVKNLAK